MKFLFPLVALFLLSGCADNGPKFEEMTADQLYKRAESSLKEKKYKNAAIAFDEVERQHPYSDLAMKGQIMAGYCYYIAQKYEDAIDRFQNFQMLHPSSSKIPYVTYMIGICQYEQMPIVERDQIDTAESLVTFTQLINAHPRSDYAKDAKLKVDLIKDHLAAKQMSIGRFYLNESSPLAALGRFKSVVDTFETSTHTPEALYRMVEAYLLLGMLEDARITAAVLGHNYSNNQWYKKAFDLLRTYKQAPAKGRQKTLKKRAAQNLVKDLERENRLKNSAKIATTQLNKSV